MIMSFLSRTTVVIKDIGQDFHYAMRRLRFNVGFSIVAVLMLALGIGANAAVYSLMDQILLRPFSAVLNTERLVQIGSRDAKHNGRDFDTISYPDYLDYRRTSRGFESIAAFQNVHVDFTAATGTEEANADVATTNYFDTVGVKAQLGNIFHQVDEQLGQSNAPAPVAVISADTWKRRFNNDVNIIGVTVHINKSPFVIIGIAPPGFQGTELRRPVDVWVPITAAQTILPEFRDHLTADRSFRWLQCIARVRTGVSVAQAQADVDTIAANLGVAYPQDDAGKGTKLDTHLGLSPVYRNNAIKLTALLQGGAGLLLLITCSNLAALQLASAARREREMAIRSALGATTGRMIRQLLLESGLLSALGVIATVPVTFWAGRALSVPLLGGAFPHIHIALNKSVLIFTIGLALITTLLFGLMPAWSASTMRSPAGLKGVTNSSGVSQSAARKVLVICQVALSFVLLISASLLVRTLVELQNTDPGFRTQGILKASIDLSREGYDLSRGREFYHQFLTRVQSLPGVVSSCLTTTAPADQNQSTNIAVGIEGRPIVPHQPGIQVRLAAVTPEYFRTLGLSLVKGRGFSERDNDEAPLVAIVNESLAKQFWESEDIIGKHFHLVTTKSPLEAIGVIRNSTIVRLDEQGPQPFLYVPLDQFSKLSVTLLVQTRINPMSLLPAVNRELAMLDPDVPLARTETLRQHLDDSLGQQRLMATLIAGFAVLALMLAELGLYAVISQSVNARTREMGIRMALGSRKAQLIGLVVKQGMILAIIGLAVGFIAVCALAPYLKTFLFHVQLTDTATFAGVSLCLLVVALVASYLPSRRAAQVDPILALRQE